MPTDTDPVPTVTTPEVPTPVPLCLQPDSMGTSLCIDEAQSHNDSTIQASDGYFPDWIELRNAGSVPIDRQRIGVQFGDSDPVPLTGEALQPGETILVFADPDSLDPGVLPMGLSDEGESALIFVDGVLADQLEVPPLGRDLVYGRYVAGESVSCVASPGEANTVPYPCDDPRDRVFGAWIIQEFELTIDTEAWALLETSETFVHPKAPAALSFPGGTFPLVEINVKGGYGSFRNDLDTQKVGFKIDLNQFDGHYWRGMKKLTLNNMVQDPSFTHEYLTYYLYRETGLPAPRVTYARLHVNGVFMGFYAMIETVDEPFLERWYGNTDGHLFEGAYGPDFDVGKADQFDYDNGPDLYAGLAAIEEVITTLNQPWDEATYAQLRTQVDMDQWMTNMAIEAAVWHWDGYWTENNFRMYHNPATDLWQIIPHGTDQTWVDGYPNPYDGSSQPRLYDFCLAVTSCREMYRDKLIAVADVVDTLPLETVLDLLVAHTEPEFDVDPRVEDAGSHDSQIAGTRARIQSVSQALRDAAASH